MTVKASSVAMGPEPLIVFALKYNLYSMLEFRLPRVMVVSLARKFMTLTGPSSLVLFTAETGKREKKVND